MSKNKRMHKPKLTKRDKYLYIASLIVTAFLGLASWLPILLLRQRIGLQAEEVIASTQKDFSVFFILPLQLCALIVFFFLADRFEVKRLPFFTKIKIRRGIIIAFSTLVAISIAVIPLTLFARVTLTEEGEIAQYNPLNKETSLYEAEDIHAVTFGIEIHKSTFRRLHDPNYYVYVTFDTSDGDQFYFANDAFAGDLEEKLTHLLHLKNIYTDITVMKNEDRIDDFIKIEHLSETEAKLLKQLFEIQ